MMTYRHDIDTEGTLAPWEPPTAIAPVASPTPGDALAKMEAIRLEIARNTAALAQYRAAPPPVPYAPPMPPAYAPAPQYHAPQYQAPQYQAPSYGDYSPTILVHVDTTAHSAQDNGGGGWVVTILGLGFFVALVAAVVGGQ